MIYEDGQPQWNNMDRAKPNNSDKRKLSQCPALTAANMKQTVFRMLRRVVSQTLTDVSEVFTASIITAIITLMMGAEKSLKRWSTSVRLYGTTSLKPSHL
jgi:hypothetical protein